MTKSKPKFSVVVKGFKSKEQARVCKYPTYHVQYKHSGLFTWYYNTVEVPKQVYDKINDGDTMLVFSTKGK